MNRYSTKGLSPLKRFKLMKRFTALTFSFCLMIGFSFGQGAPKDSTGNESGDNSVSEASLAAPAVDKGTGVHQFENNYFPLQILRQKPLGLCLAHLLIWRRISGSVENWLVAKQKNLNFR